MLPNQTYNMTKLWISNHKSWTKHALDHNVVYVRFENTPHPACKKVKYPGTVPMFIVFFWHGAWFPVICCALTVPCNLLIHAGHVNGSGIHLLKQKYGLDKLSRALSLLSFGLNE